MTGVHGATSRGDDPVARIGGDEFVALCRDIDSERAEMLAQQMLDALLQPFVLGQTTVEVGASIGLAHDPDHVTEQTLEAADRALYVAKSAGRGVYRWASEA
ncbi:MAG: GGDEF domain-containing protein [Acidimicrobiia bacterium]|nr:GGDEF domain-containing protein [Acidimicrobiia bacterium]